MSTVTGRFAEARLYLVYCAAVLWPGRSLPTFAEPHVSTVTLDHLQPDDLTLVIEEGRRQFDRQAADLDRIRNRAGALATVSLALTVGLVSRTHDMISGPWPLTAAWVLSCLLALLAVAGACAVMAGRAVLGRMDTGLVAQMPHPVQKSLAAGYVEHVGAGEETVRTVLTVLRDAVTLVVVSALIFLVLLLCTLRSSPATDTTEPKCPTSTTCSRTTPPR
ncbi:hypothetical protein IAG44_05900 [Streptomyces roseirectus]|uniref:Uncharacterized protein n=1 Tax=Streptomyces roseirectus TaxID=2768066 RepID=A0A7H0I8A8_9ACTN|nr:hypothetical protein [Streptomyces roseirectus]QNP69024.1 hypothetical protein IAG44_05900 [Streptomyces roseirectus]